MSKQRVCTFNSTEVEILDKKINDYIKSKKDLKVLTISHSSCPAKSPETGFDLGIINYSVTLLVEYDK